ncbi:YbaN family protein [Vibrio clamense]|uniref:YbaN family protein n=1 Tax=Vibrio clamense TaxID=2910254 RepID=UPI003D2376E6
MIGGLSLLLGIVGIVLPLLPTTPFLLLSSACFVRSSPRFHHWLHTQKTLGPILENWQRNGAVTNKVKMRGLVLILLSFSFSIFIAPILWVKFTLIAMLVVLITWFVRIPVHEPVANRQENH